MLIIMTITTVQVQDVFKSDPICGEVIVKFSTELNILCFAFKLIPLTTQHTDLLNNGSLQDPSAF